jgi:hypothetical protein
MKQISILLIAAVCALINVHAQDNDSNLNRELTLEKEYAPTVKDANKINELPEVKAPEVVKSQVQFSDYVYSYAVTPSLNGLVPQSYFSDLARTKNQGYLNFGVSTQMGINGDIGYQILNDEENFLSVYASNRYTDSNVKIHHNDEKTSMKMNDILGGINYKHAFEKVIFSLGGEYNYSKYNYYGNSQPYDPFGRDITEDLSNNFFNLYTGVQSKADEELLYDLFLNYTNFRKKIEISNVDEKRTENRFLINGKLQKRLDATWTVGLAVNLNISSYSSPKDRRTGYSNATLVEATPYVLTEGTNWNVKLGIKPFFRMQKDNEKFRIAPDIQLNYMPSTNFQVYLHAMGGNKDNSLYNMHYENRYVSYEHRIMDSYSPLDATLGFKYSPAPRATVELFAGYQIIKDEHFFVPFSEDLGFGMYYVDNTFRAAYNDANVFKIGGAVSYKYEDLLDINLRATYYNWDVEDEEYDWSPIWMHEGPWHKPTFVMDISLEHTLSVIPLSLKLDYHLETGRKGYQPAGVRNYYDPVSGSGFAFADGDSDMKNIHDLKLSGNYIISDNISIFAIMNNMLCQKYDIWYGYPTEKPNLMGGVSFKF